MEFIIKKEDLKEDIVIRFDNNIIPTMLEKPLINFENGVLSINIEGLYIKKL